MTATAEGGDRADPADKYLASESNIYAPDNNTLQSMAEQSLPLTGGSQSHNNMQPFIAINYIIALQGLYPSRG